MKKEVNPIKHTYKFSFVMPVYNAEHYLDETVESLLQQTLDFKQHIQLILINDGSTDGSEKICLKYKKLYPENVVYVWQENQGVSSARNRGLDEVKGKYISFLDSDDKLSLDTTEKVSHFFDAHYNEIDLVAIRMQLFGSKEGEHALNYRFHSDRVIDIATEFSSVQSAGGSTFVKSSAVANSRFRTGMKIAEDVLFITDIILKKKKYGVVADPIYFYRKHDAGGSATAGLYAKKHWYIQMLDEFHSYIMELSHKPVNKTIKKYLQYLIMYEMQWRFMQAESPVLSRRETAAYKKRLYELTSQMDDDVILTQADLHTELKFLILSKKYSVDVLNTHADESGRVYFNKEEIYDYNKEGVVHVDILKVSGKQLVIKGTVAAILFGNVRFGFKVGGTFYEAEKVFRLDTQKTFLDEVIFDKNSFTITVPIKNGENIQPTFYADSGFIKYIPMKFGAHARLSDRYPGYNYIVAKDFLVCSASPSKLVLIDSTITNRAVKELKLSARMAAGILKGGYKVVLHSLFYRVLYFLSKIFIKKQVWIFSDRTDMAGDNAEALLKYVVSQNSPTILPYFAISKQSPDYKRLRSQYRVIDRYSFRYKVLFLLADKLISSQAGDVTLNPFGRHYSRISNLLQYDFIFLSHGINKDDISKLYNKYTTNASLYTTVTQKEYDSMFIYPYGFDKQEVVLTGFARYDKYAEAQVAKNKVVIAPTWRKNIAGEGRQDSSDRDYNEEFRTSEYFTFYQGLISNKTFHHFLKKHKLKAEFVLHPAIAAQAKDFKGNAYVKIQTPPHDYKKYIEEAKLLITDYSGVAFDAAYLEKPMVYVQFDKDSFYDSHTLSEGSYSYSESGFGPVVEDVKGLMSELEKIAKNNFVLARQYRKRLKAFFRWIDRSNCLRIYQSILSIDPSRYIDGVVKKRIVTTIRTKRRPRLRVYWWRYSFPEQLNFGDEITPYIIRSLFGLRAEHSSLHRADLAGAGSIIEMVQRGAGDHSVKVWGSGFIRAGDKNHLSSIDFSAVRGPLSLKRVDTTHHPVAIGDPGLLANRTFKKSRRKTHKVGIIAHYVDKNHPALEGVKDDPDYLLIDPLQTPDKVARDITACEYILSSSLHGIIFSDSFNIPNNWMPLSDKVTGGDYKFTDYYLSTGRETRSVTPSIIGNTKAIQQAIDSYEPVVNLKRMQRSLMKSFPFR